RTYSLHDALPSSLRGYHCGRIKTLPSLVNPDFCPGMSIQLTNLPTFPIGCQLSTLITCNHTCRNSHISHQHHKTGSIVFTKTLPGFKQKFINPVFTEYAWFQGIYKMILLIPVQDCSDITSRILPTS